MKYTKQLGTNNHVIIHLHGTGGTSKQLFSIGRYLDSEATLIGIDGEVYENGMRRYFERYGDGSFNLESLKENTDDLFKTINGALIDNKLEDYVVTILGYSNGANIAINLIKEYETIFNNLLLFHPSTVRKDIEFKSQENLSVFITRGENDPFINEEEFVQMIEMLKEKNIEVNTYTHLKGHELINEEITKAKETLKLN